MVRENNIHARKNQQQQICKLVVWVRILLQGVCWLAVCLLKQRFLSDACCIPVSFPTLHSLCPDHLLCVPAFLLCQCQQLVQVSLLCMVVAGCGHTTVIWQLIITTGVSHRWCMMMQVCHTGDVCSVARCVSPVPTSAGTLWTRM